MAIRGEAVSKPLQFEAVGQAQAALDELFADI
jgi:hypothetical protein